MANEPLGVGTLTALAVSFLSKEGITLVTAFPAPVSVIVNANPSSTICCACYLISFGHWCRHELFLYGLTLHQMHHPLLLE